MFVHLQYLSFWGCVDMYTDFLPDFGSNASTESRSLVQILQALDTLVGCRSTPSLHLLCRCSIRIAMHVRWAESETYLHWLDRSSGPGRLNGSWTHTCAVSRPCLVKVGRVMLMDRNWRLMVIASDWSWTHRNCLKTGQERYRSVPLLIIAVSCKIVLLLSMINWCSHIRFCSTSPFFL